MSHHKMGYNRWSDPRKLIMFITSIFSLGRILPPFYMWTGYTMGINRKYESKINENLFKKVYELKRQTDTLVDGLLESRSLVSHEAMSAEAFWYSKWVAQRYLISRLYKCKSLDAFIMKKKHKKRTARRLHIQILASNCLKSDHEF